MLAANAIYVHGRLIDSLVLANNDILNISALLTEFEERTLPATKLSALNMMKPSLFEVRFIIFDTGLQQQMKRLEYIINDGFHANFSDVHRSLKQLRFDRIENDVQFFSAANVSSGNVFGNITTEFSKWRHLFKALTEFSQRNVIAFSWVDPWIASTWPWLFVMLLSFLQIQSVVMRSHSIFSTIMMAATWLQLLLAFVAFILFSVSVIIGDLCSFLPAHNAESWQIIAESSIFWNRLGKGCLSEEKRNMFAAFDPDETITCNSVLNVTEYSTDIFDVLIASRSILSARVASDLKALEGTNPKFVADFSAIRSEINQSSTLLALQWPHMHESMQQASNNCALVLHRFVVLINKRGTIQLTPAQIRFLCSLGIAVRAFQKQHVLIN